MALCSFGKSREMSPFSARISPYETNSGSIEAVLTLRIITLLTPSHITRISSMVTGKRLADIGYRAFSGSMMLLTVYGGYLCAMRGYRYMQKQKQLKLAAENQDPDAIKE